MNKIFKEHYPAASLPKDLREGIDPSGKVTITIVEEEATKEIMSLEEIFAAKKGPYKTTNEIDCMIKRSRDEWDD